MSRMFGVVPAFTCAFSLAAVAAQQTAPAPPRDGTPAATAGAGTIRGRVTDRETGQPLGRVMVTLISNSSSEQMGYSAAMVSQTGVVGYDSPRQNEPRSTVTAADGRFEFNRVSPGTYAVFIEASRTRGTHLDQRFGDPAPSDPLKPSRRVTFELRDGETRENVDVALWRAFTLEGRVVDDIGEPVANVDVMVSEWDAPSMTAGMPRSTDDRGMFRFFGLRPGRYRVCTEGESHFGLPDELRDRLLRTCYPSAVSDSDARPVMVSSEDAGPVEIRLLRTRTYKITGIAIDSSGKPIETPNVSVNSVSPEGSSSSASSIDVKPGGQFTVSGVVPGDYAVQVSVGNGHVYEADYEAGYIPVRVDAADIDGIVVATAKPVKVSGHVVFEGGVPEQKSPKLSIVVMPDEEIGHIMSVGLESPGLVRDDMSFELTGLFGPNLLRVTSPPRGWIVKSVKYRGDDVTDAAVEFKSSSDPRLLVVTMTNQGATVTGRVLGDDGKETAEASIVLLPADLTRWHPFPGLPAIPPRPDGTFAIGPVRAGEYVVTAVTGIPMERLFDQSRRAEIVERIAKAGERIILVENEKHAIDLRVVKLQ